MFLAKHLLALPLSHVPKTCTWVLVHLTPSRPCSLSHHSIPVTNISYTSRSELPEYSSGGLIFNLIYATTESLGLSSWLSSNVLCTIHIMNHDNHDPLLGILKQSLLPAIDTSQYLVQLLVPVGFFALVIPCMLLVYHLWYNLYAFLLPLVS